MADKTSNIEDSTSTTLADATLATPAVSDLQHEVVFQVEGQDVTPSQIAPFRRPLQPSENTAARGQLDDRQDLGTFPLDNSEITEWSSQWSTPPPKVPTIAIRRSGPHGGVANIGILDFGTGTKEDFEAVAQKWTELLDENKNLKTERDALANDIIAQGADLEATKRDLREARIVRNAMEPARAQLEKQYDNLRSTVEDIKKRSLELEEINQHLQQEIADMRQALDNMSRLNLSLTNQIDANRIVVEMKDRTIGGLRDTVVTQKLDKQNIVKTMGNALKDALEGNKTALKQIDRLTAHQGELERDNQAKENALEKREKELNETLKQIKVFTAQQRKLERDLWSADGYPPQSSNVNSVPASPKAFTNTSSNINVATQQQTTPDGIQGAGRDIQRAPSSETIGRLSQYYEGMLERLSNPSSSTNGTEFTPTTSFEGTPLSEILAKGIPRDRPSGDIPDRVGSLHPHRNSARPVDGVIESIPETDWPEHKHMAGRVDPQTQTLPATTYVEGTQRTGPMGSSGYRNGNSRPFDYFPEPAVQPRPATPPVTPAARNQTQLLVSTAHPDSPETSVIDFASTTTDTSMQTDAQGLGHSRVYNTVSLSPYAPRPQPLTLNDMVGSISVAPVASTSSAMRSQIRSLWERISRISTSPVAAQTQTISLNDRMSNIAINPTREEAVHQMNDQGSHFGSPSSTPPPPPQYTQSDATIPPQQGSFWPYILKPVAFILLALFVDSYLSRKRLWMDANYLTRQAVLGFRDEKWDGAVWVRKMEYSFEERILGGGRGVGGC